MTFGAVPDFAYNTGASASEDTGESGVEQMKNGETLVVTALTDRCRCMWCMDHVRKKIAGERWT